MKKYFYFQKQAICVFALCILAVGCIPNLKGKISPHKPEFTGMYVYLDKNEEKEDILKLKILVIFENSKNELEYYFKTFTRLSFHVSDNREEIITRRGFVLSSGHELLFRESNMEEEQKLYYGQKEKDPRNWTAVNMGPRTRVRFIDKEPPSGYDRLAEISKDYSEIVFKNGELFSKTGSSFLGTIELTHGKKKLKLENRITGIVYYISKKTNEIASIFTVTNDLEPGMPVSISEPSKKFTGTIENKIDEFVFLKSDRLSDIKKYDPVALVGKVDTKAIQKKTLDPDELIRRIKSNKNLSKEELIREIEKLKK